MEKYYDILIDGPLGGGISPTGEDIAALLHNIHHHYPGKDGIGEGGKIIYFEEDLLPILKALGLPEPIWKGSISVEEWLKQRK